MFSYCTLERIIATNLFSDNPGLCLISPLYTDELKVNNGGEERELQDSVDYIPLNVISDIHSAIRAMRIKALISLMVLSLVVGSFGTVIQIGQPTLPFKPEYWKYIALQFSILSAFLFGFINVFEIHFSKRPWTKRCILNAAILQAGKKQRCNFTTAKKDLLHLFSEKLVPPFIEKKYPYGMNYFRNISATLNNYSPKTNIVLEYNRQLSKIDSSPDIIKTIASFSIGVGIEVFSFVDLFFQAPDFRTNLILVAIAIVTFAFLLGKLTVETRFDKAYVQLDSLLYLYSYMYLDMPYDREKEKSVTIDIQDCDDEYNREAIIELTIEKLEEEKEQYIYHRLIEIGASSIKVYGLE